jgi:hypothetical protein
MDLGGGAIGSPCASDDDCHEGSSPVCFVSTLTNTSGATATPGGYCSSGCTSFHDCGATGDCVSFIGGGSFCFSHCGGPGDCRAGYACFAVSGGSCLPSGKLTCDPTAPNGACTTTDGKPGGCLRQAHGPGLTGECLELCTPTPDACPGQECVVYDATGGKDPEASAPDTFLGAVCTHVFANNGPGVECSATDSSGKHGDFLDACAPGLECNLMGAFGGDNLCHALCMSGGADGGVPACPPGQQCSDVFGLFPTATPIGLCR